MYSIFTAIFYLKCHQKDTMGCCLCRDKNSWSHHSGGNGDFNNYQNSRDEETRGVRKAPNDKRSLQEILETVIEDTDSESLENSTSCGEIINDTNIGIISYDRTETRQGNQGK